LIENQTVQTAFSLLEILTLNLTKIQEFRILPDKILFAQYSMAKLASTGSANSIYCILSLLKGASIMFY